MTIHHDKLAYGKLASSREDLSEERIFEMLGELESYEEEEGNAEKGTEIRASSNGGGRVEANESPNAFPEKRTEEKER